MIESLNLDCVTAKTFTDSIIHGQWLTSNVAWDCVHLGRWFNAWFDINSTHSGIIHLARWTLSYFTVSRLNTDTNPIQRHYYLHTWYYVVLWRQPRLSHPGLCLESLRVSISKNDASHRGVTVVIINVDYKPGTVAAQRSFLWDAFWSTPWVMSISTHLYAMLHW